MKLFCKQQKNRLVGEDEILAVVTLKLISGEEIIAGVSEQEYEDDSIKTLELSEPYIIVENGENISLYRWLISTADRSFHINKSSIMVKLIPHEDYVKAYKKGINIKHQKTFQEDYEKTIH